jgi:hypothetical protein
MTTYLSLLPTDIEQLIWKNVFDECIQQVKEEYLKWVTNKRMSLLWRNTKVSYETYMNVNIPLHEYYSNELREYISNELHGDTDDDGE